MSITTGKTEGDILLSYTANKGRRTRQLTKITNFLALQDQNYSKYTEKSLIAAVKDLEKLTDRLAIPTGYLTRYKIETGPVLATEADTFMKNTQEQAEAVYKQKHEDQPNHQEISAPAQGGIATAAKPIMAWKPDKLSFDANLDSVRLWKQRFRAFHLPSNLRALPQPDQQAFIIACIDDQVANRINRVITNMTPLFPNNPGNPSCYEKINKGENPSPPQKGSIHVP